MGPRVCAESFRAVALNLVEIEPLDESPTAQLTNCLYLEEMRWPLGTGNYVSGPLAFA
jgi:hypothetical protein